MPRPGTRSRPAPRKAAAAAAAAKPSEEVHADEPETRGRTRGARTVSTPLNTNNNKKNVAAERSTRASSRKATAAAVAAEDDIEDDDAESRVQGTETPAQGQRRDTTGLDLGDDMFSGLEDSFEDSGLAAGGGGALELDASSLTLSSFKPRSRQSSFIGRNDQPLIRPSSRAGNVSGVSSSFSIGAFRRRAREPSILGTARKPHHSADVTAATTATAEADTRAVESSSEDEADFNPDDESTPLRNRRSTMPRRVSGAEETQLLSEPGSSSRKRKSAGAPEDSARSVKVSRLAREASDAPVAVSSDNESESDSELSDLPSPQALPARPQTPARDDDDEEFAAPPASSGSEGDAWPDIHDLGRRRRRLSVHTPPKAGGRDNDSNISSPPSLTHSPNPAPAAAAAAAAAAKAAKTRGRQAKRQAPSPKLTTAELANLIPQRRSKRREDAELDDDEELDTAELGQHDDELSYLDAARRRKANRSAASRPSRKAKTAAKGKQPAAAAGAKRQLRGYSRRSSDKENESAPEAGQNDEDDDNEDEQEVSRFVPLPDETFDEGAAAAARGQAEELLRATKKFKEVDRYELAFEEAIGDSSPMGAR